MENNDIELRRCWAAKGTPPCNYSPWASGGFIWSFFDEMQKVRQPKAHLNTVSLTFFSCLIWVGQHNHGFLFPKDGFDSCRKPLACFLLVFQNAWQNEGFESPQFPADDNYIKTALEWWMCLYEFFHPSITIATLSSRSQLHVFWSSREGIKISSGQGSKMSRLFPEGRESVLLIW